MEKPDEAPKKNQTYIVYEPGYLQELCLQKLNIVVEEYR